MPNTKFCLECGAPTNGGKFCPECGARTEAAVPPAMTPAVIPEAPAPTTPAALFTPPAPPAVAPEEPADEIEEGETDPEPEADPDSAEADVSPESRAAPAPDVVAAPARKPVTVATRISYDVTAEPYEVGKCTLTLALMIRPDDGHPDGPQVVIGVRSHDESPLLCVKRLKALALPPELLDMVRQYEATLDERGAVKAFAQAKAAAEKKAAEEKRKQAEAARRAKASSRTTGARKSGPSKPAVPGKPDASKPEPVALSTLF